MKMKGMFNFEIGGDIYALLTTISSNLKPLFIDMVANPLIQYDFVYANQQHYNLAFCTLC